MTDSGIRASITGWYKNHPVVFFVGLFALQMIIFYLLYYNGWFQDHVFTPLVNVYAALSGMLLNLLGEQTTVSGDTIISQQITVGIKKGCDAAEPMALFVSGILAFPSSLKKKGYGLLIGLSMLFVLNIIRIISLFYVGRLQPDLFDMMHLVVWQILFIMVSMALWFFWLRWSKRKVAVA